MPNFAQGKIYTIRCRDNPELIYVGSTTQALSVRMAGHRRDSMNEKLCNRPLYKHVAGDWENYFIELHEDYPCERREQLTRREGAIQREIATLNKRIEGRTMKEWYEDNREVLCEKMKEYNANKRAEDPEYDEKNAERVRQYRANKKAEDPEYAEKRAEKERERYHRLKAENNLAI